MLALSIKQPWSWLICAGYKDIENRDWRIGRKPGYNATNFAVTLPTRIYVHASKTFDIDGFEAVMEGFGNLTESRALQLWAKFGNPKPPSELLGAIIGEVDITGCVTESKSPWFVGKYGFVLVHPVLYGTPIPCRGQLGFFEPNIEVK